MQPALRKPWPAHPALPVPRPVHGAPVFDPALRTAPPLVAPATLHNFDGVGSGFTGPQGTFTVNAAPPDPDGDVGPNHYVQIVNTDIAIFNKSGTVLHGPVPTNTLWSGFGNGCATNNDGDGTVVYDPIADRWIIAQFSVSSTPYLYCIAVSQTGDPTGAYNRYSFSYNDFPDYPKLAVWPDAYYVTFNMFDSTGTIFVGGEVCALDRTRMLSGQAANQQCFSAGPSFGGLLSGDLDGARLPPAGAPNPVLALGAVGNQLAYWKLHVDWANPANSTFSGPTTLGTAAFSEACGGGTCIPQSGTSQRLDSLGDRLMFRLAYRNFGDHEALVANHSVSAGSRVGVRWYEVRLDSQHNPSIFQQGTYAPDGNYRWMGSIAMDQNGDMALGFSESSGSLHPEIHYTGRLSGDTAGVMTQGEGTIINGAGSQTGSNLSRWGDYSAITVDPSDDCTFFYTNEYIPANGAFNWRTRIGSFKFPGCGAVVANDFSIAANPSSVSVTQGGSAPSTISTTVTSGAGQTVTLSASGLPMSANASFAPNPINAGSSSTLTLSAGASTPPGTYTITITGTGTSATRSTSVSFTVTAPTGGGGIVDGGFETGDLGGWTSTGSTAVVSPGHTGNYAARVGSTSPGTDSSIAQTFTVPSGGGTLSFWYQVHCPDTISYDWASATLRDNNTGTTTTVLSPTCPATAVWQQATYNLSSSAGHSVTLTLANHDDDYPSDPTYTFYDDVTILASIANPVVNPGFETGTLSGWSGAGATAVTSAAHSGSWAAQTGSTSPTNGDSTLSQTFTLPPGASTLSLSYNVSCPDTLAYDWATASLHDNATGATLTVLARQCSRGLGWQQATASVSSMAGHSVTLTLSNHDDDYPTDPTYTLWDDVSVQ
jgi:hypothetical protein